MPPMKRLTGGRIAGLYVGNSKGTGQEIRFLLLLTLDGIEGDATRAELKKPERENPHSDAAPWSRIPVSFRW